MKRMCVFVVVAFILVLNIVYPAHAGRIVLTNDEWTLSDYGFSTPGTQPGQFAKNVAQWFTGSTGNFLVYSSNFGLTGSSLSSAMTGAGYGWTVNSSPSFDPSLSYLQGFNAVFLAGNAVNNATLTQYVNGGGNVFLEGGTGVVGAAAEAAQWNTFLNGFGLGFNDYYQGIGGAVPISSPHPIFAGVSALYQNNGNDTLDINAADPRSQVLVMDATGGHGLYAVYDGGSVSVPEPGVLLLLGAGLIGLLGLKRKRQA
jgi:hypothetical protein